MSGALGYRPDGSQAALMFQIKPGSYNTGSLIAFLEDLHEHFAGAKVTLIWDNLPSHKSRAMTAWLATQARWLRAERLPGYAHDLNPIEWVWKNVKHDRVGKTGVTSRQDLKSKAIGALRRLQKRAGLVRSFFADPHLRYIIV